MPVIGKKNGGNSMKRCGWLFLVLLFVFSFIVVLNERNTIISIIGGDSKETAVQIVAGEQLKVEVPIRKGEEFCSVYAYWDDNIGDRQKLEKSFLKAKGVIYVPDTLGIHKLTIERETLFKSSYDYYYEVIPGKSE